MRGFGVVDVAMIRRRCPMGLASAIEQQVAVLDEEKRGYARGNAQAPDLCQ